MKPEFCFGINRNGVLCEGMAAKALYRECPKYDHPWYADQADWIVTDIELWPPGFGEVSCCFSQ